MDNIWTSIMWNPSWISAAVYHSLGKFVSIAENGDKNLLYDIVTRGNMTGILGLALFEGVLPAVTISIMASAVYVISR